MEGTESILHGLWDSRHWTAQEDAILLQHAWEHGTKHWGELQSSGKLPRRDNKACCNRFLFLKKRFLDERSALGKTLAPSDSPVVVSSRQGLIPLSNLSLEECDKLFLHSEVERAAEIKEATALAASMGLQIDTPKHGKTPQETSKDQIIASLMLQQILGPGPEEEALTNLNDRQSTLGRDAVPTKPLSPAETRIEDTSKALRCKDPDAGTTNSALDQAGRTECLERLLQSEWLSPQHVEVAAHNPPGSAHLPSLGTEAPDSRFSSTLCGLDSASSCGVSKTTHVRNWGSWLPPDPQLQGAEVSRLVSLNLDTAATPLVNVGASPESTVWVQHATFSKAQTAGTLHAREQGGVVPNTQHGLTLPAHESFCLPSTQSLLSMDALSIISSSNPSHPRPASVLDYPAALQTEVSEALPKRRLCVPDELQRRVRQSTKGSRSRSGGSSPLPHGGGLKKNPLLLSQKRSPETASLPPQSTLTPLHVGSEVAMGLLRTISLPKALTGGGQQSRRAPGMSTLSREHSSAGQCLRGTSRLMFSQPPSGSPMGTLVCKDLGYTEGSLASCELSPQADVASWELEDLPDQSGRVSHEVPASAGGGNAEALVPLIPNNPLEASAVCGPVLSGAELLHSPVTFQGRFSGGTLMANPGISTVASSEASAVTVSGHHVSSAARSSSIQDHILADELSGGNAVFRDIMHEGVALSDELDLQLDETPKGPSQFW